MALTKVQPEMMQQLTPAIMPAGSVIQTVQATYGAQTSSTSSTYADTGLTLNITPQFSNSKILVIAYCGMCSKTVVDTQMNIQIVRAGSSIFVAAALNTNASAANAYNPTLTYLDSPSTTSSTTYKVQFANRDIGTVYFNSNGTAVITLQEIKQ